MVVAAFPIVKIGLLLLKQLSKPLANIIKNEAKKHPNIRQYVILPTGKAFRWLESRTVDRLRGRELEMMSEEEIIELGSNAIGEVIFFGFLSIILMAEMNRQGDKKAVLRKTQEEEMMNLVEHVIQLMDEVESLRKSVKSIQSDLQVAFDVIELEEKQHTVIHDFDFLDIMIGHKQKFKKEENWDQDSPSL